jgi:hypothetical protein
MEKEREREPRGLASDDLARTGVLSYSRKEEYVTVVYKSKGVRNNAQK